LHPCKQLPSGQVSDLAEQDQSKLTPLIDLGSTLEYYVFSASVYILARTDCTISE